MLSCPSTVAAPHSPHEVPALRIAYLSIGRHIHTERWMRYFVERGHDVHLLTVQPGPVPGATVHDITSHVGPEAGALREPRCLKVRALLGRLDPDVLHTHFLTGYGYWGWLSGFRPFLLTVWGDDVYQTPFESRAKLWLARRALAAADWISGDSVDMLEKAIELGARRDRCEHLQLGVDFRQFRPDVPAAARAGDARGLRDAGRRARRPVDALVQPAVLQHPAVRRRDPGAVAPPSRRRVLDRRLRGRGRRDARARPSRGA